MRKDVFVIVLALGLAPASVTTAGDGVVALQSAAVSCKDSSGDRYVDCGNGTVTDNLTGLVWLKKADCFGEDDWEDALTLVSGLGDVDDAFCSAKALSPEVCDCGLADGSRPGEWRLPTAGEWREMLAAANLLGGCEPVLTNDEGNNCWGTSGTSSFTGLKGGSELARYWSASVAFQLSMSRNIWIAVLGDGAGPDTNNGTVGGLVKTEESEVYIWPVRGGQ